MGAAHAARFARAGCAGGHFERPLQILSGAGLARGLGNCQRRCGGGKPYVDGIHQLLRARLCSNYPQQYAVRPALEGPQDHLPEVAKKLRARRDLTVKACKAMPHMSCVAPRGAFYAFPKIDIPESDEQFAKKLLLEKHVLMVHGTGFGQAPGTQHFRIVFLPDETTLTRAYQGISEFMLEHYA